MNQICDLTKTDLVSHESWQIRTQIHMSTCLHNDFNYTPATPGWIKWLIYTKRGWTQQFPIKTMFGINDCEPARIKPLQASIHPRLRAKFVPAKKCVHHAPMCHLSAGTQCYPDTDTLVRQHSVFKQIPSQVPTPNFLKCRHGNQETNCVFDGKITVSCERVSTCKQYFYEINMRWIQSYQMCETTIFVKVWFVGIYKHLHRKTTFDACRANNNTDTHTHTLEQNWIIEVIRWELNPVNVR